MPKLTTVILAAGKGTRMHSALPKVLHQIGGKSMLQHVLDKTQQLNAEKRIVVYGHGKEQLEQAVQNQPVILAYQAEQLGTGHAVMQALPYIDDDSDVLILYADTPLVSTETLQKLIDHKSIDGISLLTVELEDPFGYGRIVRENGNVVAIVEQKDASPDEAEIREINTGIMVVSAAQLKSWLGQLTNSNSQKEYYLTDIIAMAYSESARIVTTFAADPEEVEGVNNRQQLAKLERCFQHKQAEQLLLAGVSFSDPNRFDLRGELIFGTDVFIDINVIIEGRVTLGNNVIIGAGSILKECTIMDDCHISPYSVIESAIIESNCTVGPFARLRPGTELKQNAHVGNFVELKKTTLGKGSKAGHLTYLGDATIGEQVNIGAGVITCNYDGVNKFKTVIGDRVFVGSDSQFIAPVSVGNDVTIAANTTVTDDVDDDRLVIGRCHQQSKQGFKRPEKK